MNLKDTFISKKIKMNKFSILVVSMLSFICMSTSMHSQTIIDCAAGHENFTFCYDSNDTTQFVFTNTSGLPLNLVFNTGQTENNFDEVIVLDTDGVTNLNAATPYGNNGDLTGLTFQSSGDTITLMIDSDGVISCQTDGFIEWDWDVWCQSCLNPTVSYDTDNCVEGEDFSVLVDVEDLGTATTLNINDDQGSPQQSVTTTGIVTFGPYAPSTIVVITVENADDSNCIISSNGISCLSGIFEIDDTLSTQELVEDVLFNSSCVELSNFSQSTGSDFGDGDLFPNGIGAFNANGADFPFQKGLILTSGNVLNAPGPNLTVHSDGTFDWLGDSDLEANTTATETNNASWVQFDFVPLVDQISFNFIFASEEYDQFFECDFSDAFAFIVTDQNTGVVQNLAVLPGTNIPIEVTNIHPDVPGQCPAINEEYFDKYNFAPFNPEDEAAIDFNGQIVSLQAVGDVIVGNPYTIKLVIADETDTLYDSAVFIEAGSFDIGNVDLGGDILISNGEAVCDFDIVTLDVDEIPGATYQWFKDNVELVGETNNVLIVTEGGLYRIEVAYEQAPDCIASDEILVEFFDSPVFDLGDDQSICDGSNITLDATPSNISELNNITYKWFQDGTEIIGETSSTLNVTISGLYRAEVTGNECLITDEITIQLASFSVDLGEDVNLCDVASYEIIPVLDGETDGATYLWSPGGETTPTITVTQSGTYTVEVTVNDCTTENSIEVNLGTNPVFDLGNDIASCLFNPITLDATPSNTPVQNFTYEWSLNGTILTGETNAMLSVSSLGTYSVVVNDGLCSNEDTIIISSANDINIDLGQNIDTCFENPIVLDASPSNYDPSLASYEWSLNGTVLAGETNANLNITAIGTYSVNVNYGLCSTQDTIVISPANNIDIDLGEDLETCFENTIILDASPNNYDPSLANYEWSLDGSIIFGENNATLTISEFGNYNVTVTYNVCSTQDNINVNPRADLEVSVGSDFRTCPNELNTLIASTSETDVSYQWYLNSDIIPDETSNSIDVLIEEGTLGTQVYSVVISKGLCTGTNEVLVNLYDNANCVITQGISPNNDNQNDFFDLEFLDDKHGIEKLSIFNRLGVLVYEKNNYVNEWYGQTNDGDELPTGTYFYIIEFSTENPISNWIYINK